MRERLIRAAAQGCLDGERAMKALVGVEPTRAAAILTYAGLEVSRRLRG